MYFLLSIAALMYKLGFQSPDILGVVLLWPDVRGALWPGSRCVVGLDAFFQMGPTAALS